MKIEWSYENAVLNLPGKCADLLLQMTEPTLRVLIALAAEPSESTLAERTSLSEEQVDAALSWLCEKGIIRTTGTRRNGQTVVAEDRPGYTGEDMVRICQNPDVTELLDICSAIFDKVFTPTETESLLYLYDGLRLDFEYIVRLCKFCHDIGKSSLRYLEKVAISLYDSGVITIGALESYIAKEERKNDMEYRVRRLFGIGERALTPKEDEYLRIWVNEWELPLAVLELAYNKMMSAIERPKFSYEHGILKKWIEAGVRTPEAIAEWEEKHPKKSGKKEKKEQPIGFDLDEFFHAATLRGEESEQTTEGDHT